MTGPSGPDGNRDSKSLTTASVSKRNSGNGESIQSTCSGSLRAAAESRSGIMHRSEINQMKLAAFSGMRGIDHNKASVTTEPRMRIASPFAGVFGWRQKVSQRNHTACGNVVKKRILYSHRIRIRIVENPLAAGQITAVTIMLNVSICNHLRISRFLVCKQIESLSV